jgi:hypothetical protein
MAGVLAADSTTGNTSSTTTPLISNVGWSWFTEPRALHYKGAHDRTYFGYVASTGAIVIGQWDHDTNALTKVTLGTFEPDEHNAPAIQVLNDGRLIVFYSRHNADTVLRYRISSSPEDISTLGSERTLTTSGKTTYAQIIYKYPVIVVFYRVQVSTPQRWSCRISKNNGATWGSEIPVFDYGSGEQMYMISSWRWNVAGNSVADIVLSGHPDVGTRHGVSYCSLRIGGSSDITIRATNGTTLLDLNRPNGPITTEKIPTVYDPSANNGISAWIWDVYATSDSYVYCVYATFPSSTDHRYNYARYNPATQQFDIKSEICAAGGYIGDNTQLHYSGGMAIAKNAGMQDVIYTSQYSTESKKFEIVDFSSPDGGLTWQAAPRTNDTTVDNVRPVAVVNGSSDFPMYWETGTYTKYTNPNLQMIVGGGLNTTLPPSVTLTASNTTPTVGQSIAFTATLKNGITPLSGKSVTIYHYFNGVKYTDTTATTNANGQIALTQSFSSTGQRTYYATFAGDSTYQTSTSGVTTINVGSSQTTTPLSASPTTTPTVGSPVTFTAALKSGNTALSGKPVTIYHYFNGVKYTDTTANTNSAGQIKLTQSFRSTGQRTYYATFAGDGSYGSSTSSVVTINVR